MKKLRKCMMILFLICLCAIPVQAKTLNVKLTKKTAKQTMNAGTKLTIKAKFGKKAISYKKIKFSTSKKAVATVSKKGVISAKKPGKAVITLKYKHTNKKTYITKIKVTVVQPVKSVKLDKSTLTMTERDKKVLTATVLPSNATNKSVTWKSSAPSIVSVTSGTVIAKKAGKAVVTVTTNQGGKTATCTITVKKKEGNNNNNNNNNNNEGGNSGNQGNTEVLPPIPSDPQEGNDDDGGEETFMDSLGFTYTDSATANGIKFWILTTGNNRMIQIYSEQNYNHSKVTLKINNGNVQFLGINEPYTYNGKTIVPEDGEYYVVPNMKTPIAFIRNEHPNRERNFPQYHTICINAIINNQNLPIEVFYNGTSIYKTTIKTSVEDYSTPVKNLNFCKSVINGFVPPVTATTFLEKLYALHAYIEENYTYDEIDCKVGAMVAYYYAAFHGYKARYCYQEANGAFGYTQLPISGHTWCEVEINGVWKRIEPNGRL